MYTNSCMCIIVCTLKGIDIHDVHVPVYVYIGPKGYSINAIDCDNYLC